MALVAFNCGSPARPLSKSQSLPNFRRTASSFAVGGRGLVGAGGGGRATDAIETWLPKASRFSQRAMGGAPFGGSAATAPQALAMMSTFYSDGRTQLWNGRMGAAGYWGVGPPKTGIYKKVVPRGVHKPQHVFEADTTPATFLRKHFERGDFPIIMRQGATLGIEWKVEPERLDYLHHLPLFFDGLLEKVEPFSTIATVGLRDMINAAKGKEPPLLRPAIPVIIIPIRRCLNTRDNVTMARALNMLQLIIRTDPGCGELLVPYYRQLLPTFNLFKANNANLGDGIDYAQRKRENIGDLVAETLELMERSGGEDAFINIKYMIPTYESCMI